MHRQLILELLQEEPDCAMYWAKSEDHKRQSTAGDKKTVQ
jgi:hypothetical protein